jgi:hypothetical protein
MCIFFTLSAFSARSVHFPHSLWYQFDVKITYVHFPHSLCIFLTFLCIFLKFCLFSLQSVNFPYSLCSQFEVKYNLCISLRVCAFSSHSVVSIQCKNTICSFSSQPVLFPMQSCAFSSHPVNFPQSSFHFPLSVCIFRTVCSFS